MPRLAVLFSRAALTLMASAAALALLAHLQSSGRDAASSDSPAKLLKGLEAMGDWRSDAPGVRRLLTTNNLPRPYATGSAENPPRIVARPADAWPHTLPGFQVQQIATGLDNPRLVKTAPNGDLFVAESYPGRIRVLRATSAGAIQANEVFAFGLHQPFGIAFYPPGPDPQFVYVGDTDAVVRFPYRNGDLKARAPLQKIADLPGGGFVHGGGHWTRDVVFSQDGKTMFVSVGSRSNVDDDASEYHRADILEFNPDGSGERIYAWGVRNAVGIAVNPSTGDLWASVNERDDLGDDLPPDYITRVVPGGFYGWPWYYIGPNQDPRHKGKHPELKAKVLAPDVLLQAHSASLQMTFYTGKQFPKELQGYAFAAEHGSWNRAKRTGYKIISVPVINGRATGEYDDFVTGFVTATGDVWGRPVGVAVASDGSLVFTDDGSNSVWRVSYAGR